MKTICLTPENTLSYQLEERMFEDILSGKLMTYEVELVNNTSCQHLEVEQPIQCKGSVYLYNDGVFPYTLNTRLEYILFCFRQKTLVCRIKACIPSPNHRFRFLGNDVPCVFDAQGDCTIWSLVYHFELI